MSGESILPFGFQNRDALLEQIVEFDDALFDRTIEALQAIFGIGDDLAQPNEPFVDGGRLGRAALDDLGQDGGETFGTQELVLEIFQNEIVEGLHTDVMPLTDGVAALMTAGAGVIGIVDTPAIGSGPGHAGAAGFADGETSEQRRPVDHARRGHARIVRSELLLNPVEEITLDDGRYGDLDDRRGIAGLGGSLLSPGAEACDVGLVLQNEMEWPDPECRAEARAIAATIEVLHHLLDAHRSTGFVAFRIEAIDEPHRLGLDRVDLELLLDLGAATFRLDRTVAERRASAVPEPLFGRFPHRPQDILGVLLRGVFVEEADELPHQVLRRVITGRLRDGGDGDAELLQTADGHFHLGAVAEEAREGVDDDDVEGTLGSGGSFEHLLEHRPAIVGGACAGFDEFGDDLPALLPTIGRVEISLRRQRDVVDGLTTGRHTQIECGPLHGRSDGGGGPGLLE